MGDHTSVPIAEWLIYILDVNTGKISKVSGSQGLFAPRWSPDGKRLLAAKADSTALLLFDFAKQRWSTLAQGLLGFPSWSEDSAYVYALDAHLPQKSVLVRIRISDRKVESVADLSICDRLRFPG